MFRSPSGQQEAPGPPMDTGSAQPPGSHYGGVESSSGNKVDITASLIVGDRSRDQPESEKESVEMSGNLHEESITLAGPMRDWDPLYIILIIQAMMISICAACAVFLPYSFTVHEPFNLSTDKHYGLFDSVPCSESDADDIKHAICYEGTEPIGVWVLLIQIFGPVGLVLSVASLLLHLINLCCSPRSRKMHDAALSLMATASIFLMVAGHIIHNRAVWTDVVKISATKRVAVEPITSGLYLVCTLFASWHCVLAHVSTHSPGPLSKDTRFAHTFAQEPSKSVSVAQADVSLSLTEETVPVVDHRKVSIMSTEV